MNTALRRDAGGNLATFAGDKTSQGAGASHTQYLQTLLYDKFEQRTYVKLGNGVDTTYTYDPKNRRLNNLLSQGQGRQAHYLLLYPVWFAL